MRIFLDANILVSVLNKEYPVFPYSSRVLGLTGNKNFLVFTSPICVAIAFYFAEKKSGTALARQKMEILTNKINIATTDHETVLQTLKNKAVEDFEDGLEYYTAVQAKCQCIITEDIKDFYFSKLEVLSAEEFLVKYFMTSK